MTPPKKLDFLYDQLPRPHLVAASETMPHVSEATDQALPRIVAERVFALRRVSECAATADKAGNPEAMQAHRRWAIACMLSFPLPLWPSMVGRASSIGE